MKNPETLPASKTVASESATSSQEKEASPEAKVQGLVELIMSASGLDNNQVRTVILYAIATYGLAKLEKFPVLVFQGPAGTGKTTLLGIMRAISCNPSDIIDGKVSKSVLRDSLKYETTALVDEADEIAEEYLVNRFSRESSIVAVNKPSPWGWQQQKLNLFGGTAMHRRKPFKDHAILSRSIVLRTKNKKGGAEPFKAENFEPYASVLQTLAEIVDWEHVKERGGSRTADSWAPLLEVDATLEGEWTNSYATGAMAKAEENLETGQGEEPSQAVFLVLLSLAMSEDGAVEERVLLSDITENLAEELGLGSWQVGSLLRDLGFPMKKAGGKTYALIGGKKKLVEVAKELGIEDEWLADGEVAA